MNSPLKNHIEKQKNIKKWFWRQITILKRKNEYKFITYHKNVKSKITIINIEKNHNRYEKNYNKYKKS